MKAILLTRFLLNIFFTIVFLSIPLLAQSQVEKEKPYDGPIYIKPLKPHTSFDIKIRSFEADGELIELYYVSTPYFGIEMKKPRNWSRKIDQKKLLTNRNSGLPTKIGALLFHSNISNPLMTIKSDRVFFVKFCKCSLG